MKLSIQEILHNDTRRLQSMLGIESSTARIEVQMLLQHVLGVTRSYLIAHSEQVLDEKQAMSYQTLLQRRSSGEPIAYILGKQEFYGLEFKVTPATLIPRPETELLVDQALQYIAKTGAKRVLDLGTGSGAIALAIAHARPDVEGTAVDASREAIAVASENLRALNISNVRLLCSDWFEMLEGERFDLIVSNPPYVADGDVHLAQGDLRFEPKNALASGADGLADIRNIIGQAKEHLNLGGHLLFEHGYDQAEHVRTLLQHAGFINIYSLRDLSGIERASGGSTQVAEQSGKQTERYKLEDTLRRPLRDLRISVTDRCNLRCTYCMPSTVFDKNHVFLPRTELLSFEEIVRLAKIFVGLGVQKIRLTGGEPLLRRGIEQLVGLLSALKTPQGQYVEIAMTTNGVLLSGKESALKDAGLSRITVSLDSLNDKTFKRISDTDVSVQKVLDGIAAAQSAGFEAIKVNMVVQRGVNDHEIVQMAEYFRNRNIVLRFIEYMDVGSSNGWKLEEVISARQILQQISLLYPLEPVGPDYPGEVAQRWRYCDGGGEIGVIAAITQAFCQTCSRARISTDGKLYTCLFASQGLDLRYPLRNGANEHALSSLIADCWHRRSDRYSEQRHAATDASLLKKIEMSYIGG